MSFRKLFTELLDQRLLLATCPAGYLTFAEVADEISSVKGATIIAHGFQPEGSIPLPGDNINFGDGGDSLRPLAEAIFNRVTGWLVDYDIVGGQGPLHEGGQGCFEIQGHSVNANTNELVLLFDWAAESNEKSPGWGEAAADALFGMLVELKIIRLATEETPGSGTGGGGGGGPFIPGPVREEEEGEAQQEFQQPSLHFIGHSFGTAVISEVIERLAHYKVAVDHVTYLDPHDFDQSLVIDTKQDLKRLGRPRDYGATVWNNVSFADVYYQTTDEAGQALPFVDWEDVIPEGRPIPGAYNVWLRPDTLLGGTENFRGGDHSDVWSQFYLNTVTAIDRYEVGYRFSRLANPLPSPFRPSHLDPHGAFYPNMSPSPQDHEWSPELLVLGSQNDHRPGVPNDAGLAAVRLTENEVQQGRWKPEWNSLSIINGDFEYPGEVGQITGSSTIIPGWTHHGGGGEGHVDADADGNHFLELDFGNAIRSHNWLYVPHETLSTKELALLFDYQRTDASVAIPFLTEHDTFRVSLGGSPIGDILLDDTDPAYNSHCIAIPKGLRGQTHNLSFEIKVGGLDVDSEVRVDNVRFAPISCERKSGVDVVEVIDRSGSMLGGKLNAAKNAASLFVELMAEPDKVGAVSYGSDASLVFPLTEVSPATQNQLKNAISSIVSTGATSIGAGIRLANSELERFPTDAARAMVVMTDGEENEAPRALSVIDGEVDQSIRIFTIGFGTAAGNQLLTQIANRRNGQFFFAPGASELQQIYTGIAGLISGQQAVLSTRGTIAPGQTSVFPLLVDSAIAQATIGVNYAGSDLDVELVAPNGSVINHASAVDDADVELVEGTTFEFYKINFPIPGEWHVKIIAVDVPPEGEPFSLFTSVSSSVVATSQTETNLAGIGQHLAVQVKVSDGAPIIGANVTAQVTPPPGASGNVPLLTLFDDGGHGDGAANDGVYGATFNGTTTGGTYTFDFEVGGTANAGFSFIRHNTASVFVDVTIPVDNGQISGFVYVDVNNNGVKDTGELGIPNVPVTITGPVNQATTTGPDGSYRFTNLPAGTYTLTETQPAAFLDGIDSHNGTSLGGEGEHDRFADVPLAGGQNMGGFNFGERGLRPDLMGPTLLASSLLIPASELLKRLDVLNGRWLPFQADRSGTLTLAAEGEASRELQLYAANMTPVAISRGELMAQLQKGQSYMLYVGEGEGNFAVSLSPIASQYTNRNEPCDVNGDGKVVPVDVLLLFNAINKQMADQTPNQLMALQEAQNVLADVNGDGSLSPLDALAIINRLNEQSAEGEGLDLVILPIRVYDQTSLPLERRRIIAVAFLPNSDQQEHEAHPTNSPTNNVYGNSSNDDSNECVLEEAIADLLGDLEIIRTLTER